MAVQVSPSSHAGNEIILEDLIQGLRHQLKESKEELRNLNEKLLISEATAYSLANQLYKYECAKHKNIMESVLGMKLQHKEGKLPERLILTKKLRESNNKIEQQALELSNLKQKLRQGRQLTSWINDSLKSLIFQESSDCHKTQHLQELLAEGQRLEECLICNLSPENHEDQDNGKEQELRALRLSKEKKDEEEEEEEVKETLQDSSHEGHKTSCTDSELPDIHQPPCSSAHLLGEHEVSSTLDAAESEDSQKQEEEEVWMDARHSMELQEDEEMDEVLMDSLDEMYLVHSSCCEFSDSHQPFKSPASLLEKHVVDSTLDVANCQENDEDDEKNPPFYERKVEDRELKILLQTQARELANLKLKVQEGRDASLNIKRHLENLLTQSDHDCHQGYGLEEHLSEGCRLAECLAEKLTPGHQEEQQKEEKESPKSPATRKSNFPVQVQARGLTNLRQQLKEGSDAAFSLVHHLTNLLTHQASGSHQHQGLREQLSEGCRLADRLLCRLRQECDDDENDEELENNEELELLDSSLNSELQEKKENELLPDEQHYVPSGQPDSSNSQEGLRNIVLSSDEPRVSPVGSILTQEACLQGTLSGEASRNMAEMQASHVHAESRAQKRSYLGTQLGPHFDHGDSKVRLSLSYTNYSFAANTDSAKQWILFQELNLDACLGKKNPPKLELDAPEGSAANQHGSQVSDLSDATTVLKQKMIKRKLQCSKWRIACQFPGLQAPEAKYCWN